MTDYRNDCPFPVWAIFITTSVMIPSSIRQNTYRVPFGKGRCLVCVNDQSQTLKNPETEIWTATLAQQSINQWNWGSVNVTTGTSNYQPSITVYMRKRVKNKSDVQAYNGFNITATTEQEIKKLYGDNVIIDNNTLQPKQPDPYNPD